MITTDIAKAALENFGADAFGLSSGQLATLWATTSPTFTEDRWSLTVSAPSAWRAIASGALQWRASGAPELFDLQGDGLTGPVAVVRLHPQAVLRLERLIGQLLDGRTDGRATRPVPAVMAIRVAALPAAVADLALIPVESARVGQELTAGELTLHDAHGQILDPVAVAAALRQVALQFPAVRAPNESEGNASGTGTTDDGAIARVAALGTAGRRVRLTDGFGNPWANLQDRPRVSLGGTELDGPGPHVWSDGATLTGATGLSFGFSPQGTAGTAALSPPTASGLHREQLSVVVIDRELELLGNRGENTLHGVPAPDVPTRSAPDPVVHDGQQLTVLSDGLATLQRIEDLRSAAELWAASATVDTTFDLPPDGRWPAEPAPAATPGPISGALARLRTEATAAWVGDTRDVVVTIPAGVVPLESFVRLFPRRFLVGPPLSDRPTTSRGDGVGAVAGAGALSLLLRDPLELGTTDRPGEARLFVDVFVAPRDPNPRPRLLGAVSLPIGLGGVAPPEPASAGRTLSAVPLDHLGRSPAPILGLTPTAPVPADALGRVLDALGEAAPREAPRFPTMARTDMVAAAFSTPDTWSAVVSGAFLDRRSLRGDPRLANPGLPAGPEEHAPGLATTGALARELARAALRRTHHLVPRLITLDGGRFGADLPGAGTVAAAVLQTVAPVCENPEMSPIPDPGGLPSDWDDLVDEVESLVPPLGARLRSLPAPAAGDRWAAEVQREGYAAKHGRRDALWAWRWAIGRARRLIVLQTPLLSRTGDHSELERIDLVQALVDRLTAVPSLRLIVVVPREIPFGPGYESFAARFHTSRNEVLDALVAAGGSRVLAFHPIGFPGRPEVLRTTVGVVDDSWAILGTSSFSRRGMTFDGGLDLVFTDRERLDGASVAVRRLRREVMAHWLGLTAPAPGATPTAGFVRLGSLDGAFDHLTEVLTQGGNGTIEPWWRGPSEPPPQSVDLADPEGRAFGDQLLQAVFAAALAALGQSV